MSSDLQRVARGLVDCLDEVPQVILHLQHTADRCRENAAVALAASHGRATVAAQQLDAAARSCEAAAHYLSMAPPKARAWAEGLVGSGRTTDRPSADSADRNKATGGAGDAPHRDSRGRIKRLTLPFGVAEGEDREAPEPPLIQVARKAFERFRKRQREDEDQREEPDELDVVIEVADTGEVTVVEDDEDERKKREERSEQDLQIYVDLTEAARELLAAMAEPGHRTWRRAVVTITPDQVDATFDYPDDRPPAIVVDIDRPELPKAPPAR